MKNRQWFLSMAVALVAMSMVARPADAATSSDAEVRAAVVQLQSQIESLRAEQAVKRQRLTQIESQDDASWINQRRAEEVKALVHEVLADADTRASLLQDGMTAGHNGTHFFLASSDGSFLLELQGQIQVRYIYNDREASSDDGEFGMQIRRTKVRFCGHVASPRLHYNVQLAVDEGDNSVSADLIAIGYDLTDDLYIWAGEDKAPFLREELTHSGRQLAVERSLINEVFTVDKAQGVGLKWTSDVLIIQGMINDGAHSGDGDASVGKDTVYALLSPEASSKDFHEDSTDFGITGRIDWKVMGDWWQLRDFTSWAGEEMAVFVGAALHYQTGETGSTSADDSIVLWTIDGSLEVDGLNLYVAYVGASTDLDSGTDSDPWGLVVQGGYNIPLSNGESVEPFARWEHLDVDSPSLTDDEIDILTIGANYYFNQHNAKLTIDGVFAFDSLTGSGFSGLGLLPDSSTGDDQFALRAQFQLLW